MKKFLNLSLAAAFLVVFSATNAQEKDKDKDKTVAQEMKGDVKSAGKTVGKGARSVGKAIGKGAKATGKGVKSAGKAVGKGASTVGKNTAEVASKGKSIVVDKTFEGKVGPNGQTIYINNKSQYYWIDEAGHHHFVTESQLKNKVN